MEQLLNVLQGLIEKYQIAEEDVAAVQEALSMLENGGADEFGYEEPAEEPAVEEKEEC